MFPDVAYYTPEQRTEMAALVNNGCTVKTLHEKLQQWRPQLGFAGARSLYYKPKTKKSQAKSKNMTKGQYYTKKELALVRRLFMEGKSDQQIVTELGSVRSGVTDVMVKYVRHSLGLLRRKPPKSRKVNHVSSSGDTHIKLEAPEAEVTVKTSKAEFRQVVSGKTARTIIELLMGL